MFSFQTPRQQRKAQAFRQSPTSADREQTPAAAQNVLAAARAPTTGPRLEPVPVAEFEVPAPLSPVGKPVDVAQYWTKNSIRSLSVVSPMPLDALDAVENATELPRGYADQRSGWSVVTVGHTGFAWQLKDRNRRLPESTRLPLPSNDTLLCLIPRGEASPYTSVLACTRSGALRFWDQLTVGLDRFRSGDVAVLNDGEFITSLENCEPFGVLLATNLGRLIRVTVPSGTMDYQAALTAELLQRSRGGLFSKVGNLFGSGSQAPRVYQDDVVRIVAGKTQGEGSRSGRNVFVIGKRVLRRWVISRSGAHDLLYEEDVGRLLAENICRDMDVDSEHADSLNLEMLDASLNRLNSLVVLVSFLAGEVTKFAIFFLDCNWAGPSDPSPLLEDRKDFALQRHVDAFPRADLIVPSGGPALAIAFTDALLISTLDVANTFEETLPFGTEEQPDRIIGYAAEPPILNGGEISLKASMLLCTSHSGVVLVDYDLDKVTEDVPIQMEEPADEVLEDIPNDREERASESLRNQIEQAIFFAQERNPISFRLDASTTGNLDSAVAGISNSIVQSKVKYIDEIVQTKMQLTEKQVRLDSLVSYLQENGVLARISPAVRKELCWNAEKVAAALRGWRFRESHTGSGGRQDQTHSRFSSDIIPLAVASFLDRKRVKRTSDAQENIRLFFKNYVANVGDLFYDLQQTLKRQSDSKDLNTKASMLAETNRILVGLYEAALQYRIANAALYKLDDATFSAEPWTSTESMMSVFHDQFFATVQAIEQLAHDGAGAGAGASDMMMDGDEGGSAATTLSEQLPSLAQIVLAAATERIKFLESQLPTSAAALGQFKEQYVDLRSRAIGNLVKLGKPESAFALADAYQDFELLADLILAGSTDELKKRGDVLNFGAKYGQAFTDVYFGKLVRNGKISELLQQPNELNGALTAFFDGRDLPSYAWMHFVRIGDFDRASASLSATAKSEEGSNGKLIALSLAKMALAAAKLEQSNAAIDVDSLLVQGELRELNWQSRLVESCEGIALVFKTFMEDRIPSHELPEGFEARLDKLVALTFKRDATNPPLQTLYRKLLGDLMRGSALSVEEYVDVCTLARSVDDQGLFLSALRAMADLNMLIPSSERRQAALLSVWRRAILRDDWQSIATTARTSSDDATANLLTQTVVYHLILECLEQSAFARSQGTYDHYRTLLPKSARPITVIPTPALVAARLPNYSELEVDTLAGAVRSECAAVMRLIDTQGLDDLFQMAAQIAESVLAADA